MKKSVICILVSFVSHSFLLSQALDQAIKSFRYERYFTAENLLNDALQKRPDDIMIQYWLVRTCLIRKEAEKAGRILTATPESMRVSPIYKVMEGAVLLQKGDTLLAKSHFEQALLSAKKKDPSLQIMIAELNIEIPNGSISYALDLLEQAGKKDKKSSEIYEAKGDAFRKWLNGSEAFRNYQQASELDSKSPIPYYKIGKIYQAQNNEAIFTGYYTNAIKADPEFAPVYYQLYYYYYFRDVNKALGYLQSYIHFSDPDIRNDYLLADLYFVSKKYAEALAVANKIVIAENQHPKPRIYKLLAYCFNSLNDNRQAEKSMKTYFSIENDSSFVSSDFELMAEISEQNQQVQEADIWREKAYQVENSINGKVNLARKLALSYKAKKQYEQQAYWFSQLYALKAEMSNVDIFNWGLAHYYAHNYNMADSIFGIYTQRYPEQSFGYYWQAKSAAAIDTAMETGLAIPYYEKLIKVGLKDSANVNTKKWLIQAYGYIAAFKVNKEKQFSDALQLYDKILILDSANAEAEKYKNILEKMIASGSTVKAQHK